MTSEALYGAVARFAAATRELPDWVLNNAAWSYDAYDGVRYAFLHTTLELRQLAVEIVAHRRNTGRPPTQAQYALRQHHAAFRDVEALLLNVAEKDFRRQPAPHEWPVNVVLQHIHEVERYFLCRHSQHAVESAAAGARRRRRRRDGRRASRDSGRPAACGRCGPIMRGCTPRCSANWTP